MQMEKDRQEKPSSPATRNGLQHTSIISTPVTTPYQTCCFITNESHVDTWQAEILRPTSLGLILPAPWVGRKVTRGYKVLYVDL
jgi:hypothetical protein